MNTICTVGKNHKTSARITGLFYLLAAGTSIIALGLYKPILFDADYLIQGARNVNKITLGAILELLSVVSVAGTAIMLFPYLRKFNESLALGYFCFRFIEGILILVGEVSVLSLLTLSQSYANAVSPAITTYQTIGSTLKAVHNWTFILGPNFMLGVNTFIYSYIFYSTKLIPRKISFVGMAGAILIFIAAILEIFGIFPQVSIWGALFAVPIFFYEMTLAIWLIRKGFNLLYLTE